MEEVKSENREEVKARVKNVKSLIKDLVGMCERKVGRDV